MNPENNNNYLRVKKITLVVVALVLAAGLFGWWVGRPKDSPTNQQPNTQSADTPQTTDSNSSVDSLVSYTLPDGWEVFSCPAAPNAVFVVPAGADSVDCNANPSSQVKISIDPSNSKDCNQLQNVQNVSKHICISEFINGHKSLKAETVYNKDSSYKKDTAINAYYIDTGKGVVKVEYIHDPSSNEYQTGLEQLAKSMQVKS